MRLCLYNKPGVAVSPVEEFLNNKFGDRTISEEDYEDAVNIISKWKYAIERDGLPGGNYLKKLSNFDFIEIRIMKGRILIRFPYYRDCQNGRLVLLSGFEKTKGYKNGDEMDRYAISKLKEAQIYYDDYHLNKNNFIELPDYLKKIINDI